MPTDAAADAPVQTDFASRAAALDKADPLAPFRQRFAIPDGVIYLDGNSLGAMQHAVPARLDSAAQHEWATGLIDSWTNAGWFQMPMSVGDRIAPLIGAGKGQVAVGDSTSVNLFKCLAAALRLRPGRPAILAEGRNFPTDSYMAAGVSAMVPGTELRFAEPDEDIADRIDTDTAVLILSHVDYRSAEIRDMRAINDAAQAAGALVLWDLSHSTGAVPVDLMAARADMAVGCTYKYLNGGPGAPAFTWVNPALIDRLEQPLSGWMGHADPFHFDRSFRPAPGARRLVCGTPQVLSLSALDAALQIWEEIDQADLFAKSRQMTEFFINALDSECAGFGLELKSPRDPGRRGSHVSVDLAQGFEVVQALKARGVIGDFRGPRTMRFGFAPLYLSFTGLWQAVCHLRDILHSREWDNDIYRQRGDIT